MNRDNFNGTDYGTGKDQLGNTSGATFWDAARQIVRQTRLCLRDGAMTAWIVKAYVKAKKIVPFPDQWQSLLESEGFVVERIARAHLVQETHEPDLFGGAAVKVKERKSFFRRLAEKKGSPRIDFEVVLFARKVGPGGEGDCAVSSPPYAETFTPQHAAEDSAKLDRLIRAGKMRGNPRGKKATTDEGERYGTTPGQLGGMKPGEAPGEK